MGDSPTEVPCVRTSGLKSSANPRITSRSCVARSSPAIRRPALWSCDRRVEPDGGDAEDHADGDDEIPRRLPQVGDAERGSEVVGQEDRGERDHDQVVEEERPAGQEAEHVVVRPPHERRRAAGLRDRRRPLGVRQRDDQEEDTRAEEDERESGRARTRRRSRARSTSTRRSRRTRPRRAPAHRAHAGSRAASAPSATALAQQRQPSDSERDEEATEEVPEDAAAARPWSPRAERRRFRRRRPRGLRLRPGRSFTAPPAARSRARGRARS